MTLHVGGWLRRTVALPAGTDRTNLAITIGALQDVFQIFVNGIRIGESGDFNDFSHATLPRPRSFRIPADIASLGAPGPKRIAFPRSF
jgi:sialate O-acetylesterase